MGNYFVSFQKSLYICKKLEYHENETHNKQMHSRLTNAPH